MHQPRASGLLTGSGVRRGRMRRSVVEGHSLAHMPDVSLTEKKQVREQVWDFDPKWEFEYTPRELILMAEKILLMDPKPYWEDPVWLPADQYMEQLRHEIYTSDGTPDPAIASGLYWRTHPQGRKVATEEQRRKGHGYYK